MTGATLDECDRVLREAGAEKVEVLTFAAGRNYISQMMRLVNSRNYEHQMKCCVS